MNQDKYIMAIDQGTTSSRAIIVNHFGEIVGQGQDEFAQIYPQNGWVEHDPNTIWNNVQSVISQAFIDSDLEPKDIAALGITNQRETTVVWDKATGEPIYNAIVWQSRQSADIANQLVEDGYSEFFQEKTGLIIDAYFSATKIRWILDNVSGAQERAERGELLFGTIDTWLVHKLTDGEVHVTDYTNAARTMLFNIHTLEWDIEILELLNIPKSMLAEVKSNSEIYGYTQTYHYYGETIPIAGMAGDQQASLIGQGAYGPGMVKNTYGTGSFMIMNTGTKPHQSKHNLLTTIAYGINGEITYGLEGSIFITGAGIQWLRDQLNLFDDSWESEGLAREANDKESIYIVPAFTGLGAPYWNSEVRGAIFGLTRASGGKEFTRAMLESIAFQSKDVLRTMEEDTGIEIPELRVDGGASMNDYLMEFQADITDTQVRRARQLETTALGAAYLAGLAIGYWEDLSSVEKLTQGGKVFQPKMDEALRQDKYQGWLNAVQATIHYSQL